MIDSTLTWRAQIPAGLDADEASPDVLPETSSNTGADAPPPPRSRAVRILATAALLAVGGLVAAIVVIFASRDDATDLATAQLVPADAALYIALNTDLASTQWIAAFVLIGRLGQDDPERRLRELVADEGELEWEAEVAPFLGGDAALYLRGAPDPAMPSLAAFEGAIIIRARDPDRALAVIREQGDFDPGRRLHDGVAYYRSTEGDVLVAVVEGFLVFAPDMMFLVDVIDVAHGLLPSLADDPDFQRARDQQPDDVLAFTYFDFAAFLGDTLSDDARDLEGALEEAGLRDLLLQTFSSSLRAESDAFVSVAAIMGDQGPARPLLTPRRSRFAAHAPAETLVFASTAGIAEAWRLLRAEAGDAIDDLLAESAEYDTLDDALRDAGEALGVDSLEDVIAQLAGEVAVAIWSPTASPSDIEVVVFIEVAAESEARDLIEAVAETTGVARREVRVAGALMTVWLDDAGDDTVAHSLQDGALFIGTPSGLRAVLDGFSVTLSESERYRRALDEVGPLIGSLLYVDVGGFLDFAPDLPDEVREAQAALGGLAFNTIADGDSTVTTVALAVFE